MVAFSIWQGAVPPSAGVTQTLGDTDPISLGTVFQVSSDVTATAVRFYFGAGWDALGTPAAVAIYNNGTGVLLASSSYGGSPTPGWNDVAISGGLALTTAIGYIAVVYYPAGRYPAEGSYFDDHDPSNGPLMLTVGGSNGRYNYATGITRPANSFNFASYFPDVLVSTGGTTHTSTTWQCSYVTRRHASTAWSSSYACRHRAQAAWMSGYTTVVGHRTTTWGSSYGGIPEIGVRGAAAARRAAISTTSARHSSQSAATVL